jgi:hypothetical protein
MMDKNQAQASDQFLATMWTGNLRTLFCLTKCWQIQIIYRLTWKYIICLRCVCSKLADCFLSSPSLNICLSSLLSSVKRRHILCTGEHGKWNIKCIIFYSHECLCEILHLISTVVCQMSTLYCGKGGGGPEIFPVCPDDDSMCWMCNYRNIFIIGR